VPVIEDIVRLLEQLGPEVVALMHGLLSSAATTDDPRAYVERKLEAAAAHEAAQRLVDEALERTTHGG